MLGTFANINTLNCHRSRAFHMTFYSGDVVRAIESPACLFKVMMDKIYEAGGMERHMLLSSSINFI